MTIGEPAAWPLDQPLICSEVLTRVRHHRRALTAATYVLQERFAHRVALDDVANVVSMDKAAFSRYFRQKIGITFSSFVRRMKIVRAMHLLAESDAAIGDVARDLGFENVGSFIRTFKGLAGLTPSEYRRASLVAATKHMHLASA